MQDGVCVLSGGQLAQFVEQAVEGQQFGVGGEGVLGEEAAPGYVLAEDPDRFGGAARAFQHPGLEFLCVRVGAVPRAVVAGSPRGFGVRRDQFQYPLVTSPTLGDLHQGCPDPRLTDVRHEQVDGLVHAPCLGEQLCEVTAHGPRSAALLVRADQVQGLIRPARSQQDTCLRPQSCRPPGRDERLHHLQRASELTRPAEFLRRALRAEPLAALLCRPDHQGQVTVPQQTIHFPGSEAAVVADLPYKIICVHGGKRRSSH
ncbi:hypothetical protein [Streptomyces fungicidicus]|uniref:hypothetical protein n=1 Tax=Streptomyces fungicidicus TaxID=68203 RepID=UPI003677FFA6